MSLQQFIAVCGLSFLPLSLSANTSSYDIIDLGTLPKGPAGYYTGGINNAGVVAGVAFATTARSGSHLFIWTAKGGMQDLGPAPMGNTYPDYLFDGVYGINASRQILGTSLSGSFFYAPGNGTQFLGFTATELNDSGEVVGYVNGGFVTPKRPNEAVLWKSASNSLYLGLGSLSGNTGSSEAYGINDSEQVVGTSNGQAFLWTVGGGMQGLGTLTGSGNSTAKAINAGGEVVGFSTAAGSSSDAFLWTASGGMKDLGTLSGNAALKSEADYINASGEIIGWSDTGKMDRKGNAIQHPFLWTAARGMKDLYDLIGKTTWQIQYINGINDFGMIVGTGVNPRGQTHAFLLAPLPVIITQPVSAGVAKGANVKFMVGATSTTALSYQWQKNNVNLKNSANLSGVSTATLTITKATASNAGNYRVIVSNAFGGSVTSSIAVVKLKTK